MAKQLTAVSVDQGCEGPPLSQTDTPAKPSAEHSAHAVGPALAVTHRFSRFTRLELNAALRKATRSKAGVDDLRQESGNGAQHHPGHHNWGDASRKRWWSRSTRVKVAFGSQQLQPDLFSYNIATLSGTSGMAGPNEYSRSCEHGL